MFVSFPSSVCYVVVVFDIKAAKVLYPSTVFCSAVDWLELYSEYMYVGVYISILAHIHDRGIFVEVYL